jgi:hypothetical protein
MRNDCSQYIAVTKMQMPIIRRGNRNSIHDLPIQCLQIVNLEQNQVLPLEVLRLLV